VTNHGDCYLQLSLVAARLLAGEDVPIHAQVHHVHKLVHVPAQVGALELLEAALEFEVLLGRQVLDDGHVLRTLAHQFACDLALLEQVHALDLDGAFVGNGLARNALEGGGLARPVGTQNHQTLVLVAFQADLAHDVVVALPQVQVPDHHAVRVFLVQTPHLLVQFLHVVLAILRHLMCRRGDEIVVVECLDQEQDEQPGCAYAETHVDLVHAVLPVEAILALARFDVGLHVGDVGEWTSEVLDWNYHTENGVDYVELVLSDRVVAHKEDQERVSHLRNHSQPEEEGQCHHHGAQEVRKEETGDLDEGEGHVALRGEADDEHCELVLVVFKPIGGAVLREHGDHTDCCDHPLELVPHEVGGPVAEQTDACCELLVFAVEFPFLDDEHDGAGGDETDPDDEEEHEPEVVLHRTQVEVGGRDHQGLHAHPDDGGRGGRHALQDGVVGPQDRHRDHMVEAGVLVDSLGSGHG